MLNPKGVVSQVLETGCKPVLFKLIMSKFLRYMITTNILLDVWMSSFRFKQRSCHFKKQDRNYFEDIEIILGHLNLHQMVEEITWRRLVNQVTKQSILDHVYVKDYYTIRELCLVWPVFGDHAVVMFNLIHVITKQRVAGRPLIFL